MMRRQRWTFTYIYRTSEGERRSGEIEADSRDAAFAALRAQGIRPIKVVARDGSVANGDTRRPRRRIVVLCAVAAAVFAGALAFALGRGSGPAKIFVPGRGALTLVPATPLARQAIPGDRMRIENAAAALFKHPTERILAGYAEPGRPLPANAEEEAFDSDDVRKALADAVMVASDDFTEHVDLKRIVTGMKRELKAYLAGGGTADGYHAELVKRQRLEIAYREKASRLLREVLQRDSGDGAGAYADWLKANAALKSMGIYPLELPERLRGFQPALEDIE